jgi:hypothetical protein
LSHTGFVVVHSVASELILNAECSRFGPLMLKSPTDSRPKSAATTGYALSHSFFPHKLGTGDNQPNTEAENPHELKDPPTRGRRAGEGYESCQGQETPIHTDQLPGEFQD